jgi:plastocyanin domain-containing protein
MVRVLVIALVFAAAIGCKKDDKPAKAKEAPASAGSVQADGVRRIEIEAGKEGYVPSKILGKPGEKLILVFTRTIEGECLAELKTPGGVTVELPMNKPVEIAVSVPADGEVAFACGMDMFKGVVVAEPAS